MKVKFSTLIGFVRKGQKTGKGLDRVIQSEIKALIAKGIYTPNACQKITVIRFGKDAQFLKLAVMEY